MWFPVRGSTPKKLDTDGDIEGGVYTERDPLICMNFKNDMHDFF